MTTERKRGAMDSEFERGYVPMDAPPGIEEHEYRRWKEAGGKVQCASGEGVVGQQDVAWAVEPAVIRWSAMTMTSDEVLFYAGQIIGQLTRLTPEALEKAALTEGLRPEYQECIRALADALKRILRR